VAADEWDPDELYELCRRSYCYRDLKRHEFDRVLDMLAGNYTFDTEFPPYPKILWDKVNDRLAPERAARLIAFRSSGTIPDTAEYEAYFDKRQTIVGRLDEGFVEELHAGDIFILGSSSWQVTGIKRNRVFVEDVYGRAPTIPYWGGERISRTYDLGVLVGRFRREMDSRVEGDDGLTGGPDMADAERDLLRGVRHGFRVDPMKFVEEGEGPQAALVRKQVFGRPKPGDEEAIQTEIEKLLAEQRGDGALGDNFNDTADKLLKLLSLGCPPDRREVALALSIGSRRLPAGPMST